MIHKGTYLNIVDNSGGKLGSCIHIYGGYRKRYASIGDVILVSIKSIKRRTSEQAKIKKGDVLKALVVNTKCINSTISGFSNKFFTNSIILLNEQNKQVGTRIFVPLLKLFRGTKYLKLLSISNGVLS
jgi:large subunit ribosomal protein L14